MSVPITTIFVHRLALIYLVLIPVTATLDILLIPMVSAALVSNDN
jgi:hypothetical protein